MHSPDAFRAILERERARADRYDHEFSVVLFDVKKIGNKDELVKHLAHVLLQRKRSTDEVGWFDAGLIGVILPNTPVDGSRQFAHEVSQKIANNYTRPPYVIYKYPSQVFPWSTESPEHSPERITSDPPNSSSMRYKKVSVQESGDTLNCLNMYLSRGIPFWKRAVDIGISMVLLILLLPIFVIIAIFIKGISPGPVFFKQKRLGYLGRPFNCWKFRTMRVDADSTVHQNYLARLISSDRPMTKLDNRDDPRIIPIGNFLRHTGLDELPQLFNILRGEMSLIGPRPCLLYEAQEYLVWQRRRFDVVPGVSGLWQVTGKNRTSFSEMMRLDITYVSKRSFCLDVKIFLKTLPAIISQAKDSLRSRQD